LFFCWRLCRLCLRLCLRTHRLPPPPPRHAAHPPSPCARRSRSHRRPRVRCAREEEHGCASESESWLPRSNDLTYRIAIFWFCQVKSTSSTEGSFRTPPSFVSARRHMHAGFPSISPQEAYTFLKRILGAAVVRVFGTRLRHQQQQQATHTAHTTRHRTCVERTDDGMGVHARGDGVPAAAGIGRPGVRGGGDRPGAAAAPRGAAELRVPHSAAPTRRARGSSQAGPTTPTLVCVQLN